MKTRIKGNMNNCRGEIQKEQRSEETMGKKPLDNWVIQENHTRKRSLLPIEGFLKNR